MTDPNGAVVTDAKVTVTSIETGISQVSITDDSGVFSVNRLAPGRYSVTAEKAGFKKQVFDNIEITEQIAPVSFKLEIGQVSESVTVSGDAIPAIDTESAVVASTLDSKSIQALPSFGRDVYQLAALAPGAFGDQARDDGGNTSAMPGNDGPGGTSANSGIFQTENRPQFSANGGRTDNNGITLDGIGITSVSWGGAAIITPNEDTVKELRVVTNEYDAESGRFASGQVQVTSQNGTNQFHGSAFFKRDTPGLNAYQHFYGNELAPQTPLRNDNQFNQWGGTVGGPIIKNKLFFFFGYETIRNSSTIANNSWYETPALLKQAPAGSLAARYAAFPGESPIGKVQDQTCGSIGLIDAATAAQITSDFSAHGTPQTVTANCLEIPGQGLNIGSPLTAALGTMDPSQLAPITDPVTNLTYYRPGLGGNGLGTPNNLNGIADIAFLNSTGPNDVTNQQYMGRMDFTPTEKDLFAFTIYYTPVNTTNYNGGNRAANLFYHNAINEALTGLWNHTFSPTLINEARINAAGWRWNELNDNPQSPLGLPQTAYIGDPTNGNNIGTACPGCNSLGGIAGSIFDQWTYGFKDTVTKVQGSHTMKFGAELTKLHFVQDAPWSARPQWGFNNYWDFLNDAPFTESGTFNPQNGVPTDVRKDSRQSITALFAQDNWKVKPNLTLTAGLRWEYFGPVSFTQNQLSTAVLGNEPNPLTGLYMRIGGNLYNSQITNFGPQLGFAWSPGGILGHSFANRLVIRGGFGIGYTGEEQAILLNGWPNVPFTDNGASLQGSNIVYDFPTNPHQFAPFPANPNTIQVFNGNNLPNIGASPVGITAFPANFPTPYTERYSLEGQYDVGHNWVATLGYQGSSSRHLTRQINLNEIYGAEGVALNPVVNNLDFYAQDANSNFNAFLAEIQHRFARNFEFDTQYRYAHSMDNESGPYRISPYQWNSKADWGNSNFDVRNNVKIWGIYTPNFFHEGDWKQKVLGGWSISGIFNWHTGFPWTPLYNSTCNLIYQNGSCQNGSSSQLLPAAYTGTAGSNYSNSTFLKTGANFPNGSGSYFTQPAYTACALPFPEICPGAPQAPGIQRNSFQGPGYKDVDATLSKAFGLPKMPVLGENAQFEFRANFYNLFNNQNLTNIDSTVGDPQFGMATAALGGRTIELQARFSF
ncbi:MAG: carboxypeptidase regulatory-like domain-containing protein [Candidatus Acidiferrum sp.]